MSNRKRRRRRGLCVFGALLALIVAGNWWAAQLSGSDLVGTLRDDVVATGGETTGWGITPTKRGKTFVEVDVSAVQRDAAALCGKPVRAWGQLTSRHGVERTHEVFVITRLAAVK